MPLRLARIVSRELAGPIVSRLGPVALGLFFGVVQFWTLVSWDTVRAGLAAEPDRAALLAIGTVAAWMLSWRPLLRLLVERPALAPWWRLAPSPLTRGLALVPSLLAIASPALVAAVLLPSRGVVVVGAIVFGALATTLPGALLVLPAAALLFAVTRVVPAWALVPAAPLLAGLIHARALAPAALPAARRGLRLRAAGPVTALLLRDLLTLVRQSPTVVRWAFGLAFPAGGLLWGLRRHAAPPDALALTAAVIACAVSPLGAVALERLRHQQGATFFLRRWPPGAGVRALTLLLVTLGVFAPTGVAMAAVLVPTPGAPLLPMLLAATACGAGALAFVRSRAILGWHLWWVLAIVLLVILDTAGARAIEALAAAGGFLLGRRALESR